MLDEVGVPRGWCRLVPVYVGACWLLVLLSVVVPTIGRRSVVRTL